MDNSYRRDNELPYIATKEVLQEQLRAKKAFREYNEVMPFDLERGRELIAESGIRHGTEIYLEPPFYCEYGNHIKVGDYFYANTGCIISDVGEVVIGDHVLFGPRVNILTAGHPVHPVSRNSGYEYGMPITIGNNVWLGGNVTVCPGVTIGNNVVIGAGSVVTKDIPDNVVAVGNPCHVLRKITEADKPYYFKNRKFDDEAWEAIQNRK
ncbi:sugar O-acetyltransferase [Limosilactobacillus sp.]|jgi:acetyltransferase-like isoleucine patch superfamily enzyme|uniref:sugar O-acetyltransferase n=1 Tax=Limosilactobacillus sp. TaxID=2773925 RepID=UPI0025BACA83|nr:sugar O-acetyltransferase [Limosilactobacillus sp.]MCH3921641.1 sugar O-acetyltransferase [Limosilactobacillus sp.]MCH3928412.1 sugar O-acetyltransferase [Limosilactobacillus sp.]